MKRIAIMQPTYLPWCGYFGLMQSVDLFIFLDTVQFARRSWQQRNQIKTANGPQWLTVPVQTKGKRDQAIMGVEIEPSTDFVSVHRKSIEINYRKAPFFDDLAPRVLSTLQMPRTNLCELNIDMILCMKELLNISTPVARASSFECEGTKADLLAALCQESEGTEYLSPPGSRPYLEASDAFENLGIPIRYFGFNHPEYPQLYREFLSHMSGIDILFNCAENGQSLIASACEIYE